MLKAKMGKETSAALEMMESLKVEPREAASV
jgi:hypothetical protein